MNSEKSGVLSEIERYTIDTIALLGYLADRLPRRVDTIFKKAEDERAILVLPSIVIGEALYTLLKGREAFGVKIPPEKLTIFLEVLERSRAMQLVGLDIKGWRLAVEVVLPELHDRMVVATYLLTRSGAILTNDEEITKLRGIRALWE